MGTDKRRAANDGRGQEGTHGWSRRTFLAAGAAAAGCTAWMPRSAAAAVAAERPVAPAGPGAQYRPVVKAAFVRRKGEYGMRWPGAIYDGEAARRMYHERIAATAKALDMDVDMREAPIHSLAEGEQWIAEAEGAHVDGLLVVLLDRQEHAWPTAAKAVGSAVPSVIFSPVGSSFTTNTAPLANKSGALICATDDFGQVASALKMIHAGAKLREARFIVLKGSERKDAAIDRFGTKLRYVPAAAFLEEYQRTPVSDEVEAIADSYLGLAQRTAGPTRQDVINGVKSYVVARTILEREEGDGITMDCLGALGKSQVSLPCIAWSRMLDHGVPAACEADLGACFTHALVLYLFDRPGFQQDPVADTGDQTLIGAHCTCATCLEGVGQPPEPFFLSYHHGKRDAVPVPLWHEGRRVTVADVLLRRDAAPQMIISAGEVVGNVAVPPAGGCVVSVKLRLDGVTEVLSYPGFHHIFFYGDHKRELAGFCQLHGIEPRVV